MHRLPLLLALALAATLAGCLGPGVIADIDTSKVAATPPDVPRQAQVEVSDLRGTDTEDRITKVGVTMGGIVLQPSERYLVRSVVESQVNQFLAKAGSSASPPVVNCQMRVFKVTTPGVLSWDVTAKIELVLDVGGKVQTVSGSGSDRSLAWPTPAVVNRATTDALREVAAKTEKALPELMSSAR